MAKIELNQGQLERAAELLKAVAHPLRFKIIKLINEKGEVNVNVIYNTLKIEQSITSQHLKVLRGVNAVTTRRDGKKIFYSLNEDKFKKLHKGIEVFDEQLAAPKKAKKK